jgi:hypothetical protein
LTTGADGLGLDDLAWMRAGCANVPLVISTLTECRGGEASVDLDLVGVLAGFPQIALHLQPQPSIGRAAEYLFQSYRHVGRNPGMTVQQVGERLARDAKGLGRRGYGKA